MFKLPTHDFKLHMIFGRKGTGKSTILTKLALSALAKGQTVYSTLPIPGTYFFDGKDFGFFSIPKDSLVLIDEIGMVFDPRNFKELKPETRDIFKLQRHYGLTVYIFSQTWDDSDKKLRDLTDNLWYSKKILFGYVNVMRHITKKIVFPEKDSPRYGEIIEGYFLDFFLSPGALAFTFMPRYWKFFDSFICPELPVPDKKHTVTFLAPVKGIPGFKQHKDSDDSDT